MSFSRFVMGMRMLPNGNQRFSLVIPWTQQCRACPVAGYNIATVDYGQNGRFRAYEARGVLDNRPLGGKFQYDLADIQRHPSLIQFFLNIRGYDAGPMDGAIGPRSQRALTDFQREQGINSGSGRIDRNTLVALLNRDTLFNNGVTRHPSNQLSARSDPDFTRTLNLTWGGRPQGITGQLVIEGVREEDGLRFTVVTVTGRLNPDASFNPVEAGTGIDFFFQASPRQLCEGCRPERSFRSETTIQFRDNILSGPVRPTTVFVPNSALETSDVIAFGIVGTDSRIYLTDLTLEIDSTLRDARQTQPRVLQSGRQFMTPIGTSWVQLASRQDIDEARSFAQSVGPDARIFRTSNGWFAITGTTLAEPEYDYIAELVRQNGWPTDSMLTRGESFVEAVPVQAGMQTPQALFTHTRTLRETDLFSRSWTDSRPVYEFISKLSMGESVTVWGNSDDLGDCLASNHEGIFVKCVDLADFSTSAVPSGGTNESAPSVSNATYSERYMQVGGDSTVERIIQATSWRNSSDERELLEELAVLSGTDYRRLRDIDKVSRILGILTLIENRADVSPGTFEVLNYARNIRQGEHPTRQDVRSDSSWRVSEAKAFHIFNISDPQRVEKYNHNDGREAVFYNDPQHGWIPLNDGENDATYNYVPDTVSPAGFLNDNYQHLVLDIIPWVIWGATPEDESSISERLTLFEDTWHYRYIAQGGLAILNGQLPDRDPITTNDTSERLDIASATAPELAALLLAFGIKDGNVSFVNGDVTAQLSESNRLIPLYQANPPLVLAPKLPLSGSYNAENGYFSICTANGFFLPSNLIMGSKGLGDSPRAASMVLAPSDPITGLGKLPAICVLDMSQTTKVEALHGTGELEKFGLTNPRGLLLRFQMSPSQASHFTAAIEEGRARLAVTCEMKTMTKQPYTPVPYDYEKIGTCVLKTVQIQAIDFVSGASKVMDFSAGGKVFSSTSDVITIDAPPAQAASDQNEVDIQRARWSFATSSSGEVAIRSIVESFADNAAEIILGYENAFPFKTDPTRRLAVAVFNKLPQDEIDTRAGTEMGFGSYVIKSWSSLNNYFFIENPSSGFASAVIGIIDEVRILSVRELAGSSCEWSVSYRIWLRDPTPFGVALKATTSKDGFTFEACFRTTRTGYDIASYTYVDN
jgi:peptidoglycan hydrolase-like protein with peptidoglycan-binding domain